MIGIQFPTGKTATGKWLIERDKVLISVFAAEVERWPAHLKTKEIRDAVTAALTRAFQVAKNFDQAGPLAEDSGAATLAGLFGL